MHRNNKLAQLETAWTRVLTESTTPSLITVTKTLVLHPPKDSSLPAAECPPNALQSPAEPVPSNQPPALISHLARKVRQVRSVVSFNRHSGVRCVTVTMHFAPFKQCTEIINENTVGITISLHTRKERQWVSGTAKKNSDFSPWKLPNSLSREISWATPVVYFRTSWALLWCLHTDTWCRLNYTWGSHQLPSCCYKQHNLLGYPNRDFLDKIRRFKGSRHPQLGTESNFLQLPVFCVVVTKSWMCWI